VSDSGALPRVAVVGPLTGPRAAWGELLTDGVAAARAPVSWVTFDDHGDVSQARARAAEVVADGSFAAVIGHFNSLGAIEALPLYRGASLPVVLPLATHPDLAGDYALRLCPDDNAQAAAIAAACAASSWPNRIVVVHDGTHYGRELAERIRIAASLPATVHDDWPARLDRSAVVLTGVHHGVAAILSRRPPEAASVLVTDDCDVPEFAELAGGAVTGVRVARLAGGPGGRVSGQHPQLRGAALTAALKAELSHAEPAGTGWSITEMTHVPTGN
jgi:hypothetical protein